MLGKRWDNRSVKKSGIHLLNTSLEHNDKENPLSSTFIVYPGDAHVWMERYRFSLISQNSNR
jgi:hypothetical protein